MAKKLGRTIIIGDVHGCAAELRELLGAVECTPQDQVYFVGDLVARGPDSRGVLALFRQLNAQGVLGNHEDRLLEARRAAKLGQHGPRLSPAHLVLMQEFAAEEWRLLEQLPLYLDLPAHSARIVHAGVVPGVPIQQQKRNDLLKLRALEPDGTGTASYKERSWAVDYVGPPHIVFGHNAVAGIQLQACATGLDSGCVYGGRLTALVLEPNAAIPPANERSALLHSVPAHRRYVDFGPRFPGQAPR